MSFSDEPTLFSQGCEAYAPLAERMRPKTLDEMVGQSHILTPAFKNILKNDAWNSMIFWGPPGTGKTTFARIIAGTTRRKFESRSAVLCGVKDFREVLEASRKEILSGMPGRVLFIDEVHRLNKGQQDVLLPYMEAGHIRFIGATTENPSFEINNAICSRSVIYRLQTLTSTEIVELLKRASGETEIEERAYELVAESCVGDGRRALTLLDQLIHSVEKGASVSVEDFEALSHSQSLYYDKKSEGHYDTISAFIKSVRGSDPDAALYYLARMIEGGEDPLFIARRLIILASEDVGNANPMALVLANNAFQAVHNIGMPEARIILSQATTYLACSEKSNRSYVAIDKALETVRTTGHLDVPMALKNAANKQMKQWGYGKGYQYAHNSDAGWVPMQFLPDAIKNEVFYEPKQIGVEQRFKEFLSKRKGRDQEKTH